MVKVPRKKLKTSKSSESRPPNPDKFLWKEGDIKITPPPKNANKGAKK